MSDHPTKPNVVATHGVDPEYKGGGAPKAVDPTTGQHRSYWVLSEEERKRGFVRPVRLSYVHAGNGGPEHPTRKLTAEEQERYGKYDYVLFEEFPEGDTVVGRFWTSARLAQARGCGQITSMSQAIAETYARDPKFYGSTFCATCKDHFPVGEFVWHGTEEKVGT